MTETKHDAGGLATLLREGCNLLADEVDALKSGIRCGDDGALSDDPADAHVVEAINEIEDWIARAGQAIATLAAPTPAQSEPQDELTECAAFSAGYEAGERDGRCATPSSAGDLVSREAAIRAAAKVLLDAIPNPTFDKLKPVLMGEFSERIEYTDDDGNTAFYNHYVSWDSTKKIISAALRALAGEGRE